MGDVLHALPAVAALRRQQPRLQIDWVVDPRWAPLLLGDAGDAPVVSSIIIAETRLWSRRPCSMATLRSLQQLRRTLRQAHYDAVVDLQGTIRSAVIGRMAHSSLHAGFADPREAPARWLYNRRIPRSGTHIVEQEAGLLGEALGHTRTDPIRAAGVALPRSPRAEEAVDRRLEALGVPAPFALLAPAAGWGAKQWAPDRFAELADRLALEGWTVLLNQGTTGDETTQTILRQTRSHIYPFRSSVAELLALTRRCGLVVGGDSGPVHLAAALQVPVVALFGPTDPARNGPWGAGRRQVLRHPASLTSYKRTGEPDPGLSCLTVEAVLEATRTVAGRR